MILLQYTKVKTTRLYTHMRINGRTNEDPVDFFRDCTELYECKHTRTHALACVGVALAYAASSALQHTLLGALFLVFKEEVRKRPLWPGWGEALLGPYDIWLPADAELVRGTGPAGLHCMTHTHTHTHTVTIV
ncbi:hypothetical protein Vretifemale_15435 [Volvox reticuliferus]|uniref:Uncharacterized protein n=1 Tax=Volvox reticuliferus TaxID=1737510 RepID=A0A8J4CTT3_9CHLO|nr:hypothetical protein Vretifemale_15435 [Volvox reticuliferus]